MHAVEKLSQSVLPREDSQVLAFTDARLDPDQAAQQAEVTLPPAASTLKRKDDASPVGSRPVRGVARRSGPQGSARCHGGRGATLGRVGGPEPAQFTDYNLEKFRGPRQSWAPHGRQRINDMPARKFAQAGLGTAVAGFVAESANLTPREASRLRCQGRNPLRGWNRHAADSIPSSLPSPNR